MFGPIRAYLILTSLVLTMSTPANAIIISHPSTFTAAEVDPILNDVNFLNGVLNSSQFDFSGVGFTSANGWATMISPTLFLSATHAAPSAGTQVHFHDENGNVVATHTISVGSAFGGGDLYLGSLTTAVDTSIVKVYDLAAPVAGNHVGTNVIQVGRGGTTTPDFRVGQNQLDGVLTNQTPGGGVVGTSDFAIYLDNSAAGGLNSQVGQTLVTGGFNLLDYETFFVGGDSGGPSFIDAGGGSLELIGIHSFQAQLDLNGDMIDDRRGNGDVYLPNYSIGLNNAISAVPEPSSVLLLASTTLAFTLVRRRRS